MRRAIRMVQCTLSKQAKAVAELDCYPKVSMPRAVLMLIQGVVIVWIRELFGVQNKLLHQWAL